MKIYLSEKTCERLKNTADHEATVPVRDGGIPDKMHEQIIWELTRRDDKNRLTLSPKVAEWVFALLDWYCSAYEG